MKKIIRSICLFRSKPALTDLDELDRLSNQLSLKGFEVQTKRICSNNWDSILTLDHAIQNEAILLSPGALDLTKIKAIKDSFYSSKSIYFHMDLTKEVVSDEYVDVLMDMIHTNAAKTFYFAYSFCNPYSSPYFPSTSYEKDGFSIGLQSTDLSHGCVNLNEWLIRMKDIWSELNEIFKPSPNFIGIDSSVAPMFKDASSLIGIVGKFSGDFSASATSDFYLKITNFIKSANPKPVGLNGIMFPVLEDFELADEYEKGNFPIERNIFLSLHSGLGIDTYPIGIDEKPIRVLQILKLLQGLAIKYSKPFSCRFVSDGKAKIGQRSDFRNQYLQDVVIRVL